MAPWPRSFSGPLSAADDRRREASLKSVVENLAQVTEQTQHIVREEIELAKAEVTQKISSLGRGAAVGGAAGVFVAVGALFFLHFVAFFFWWVIGSPGGQIFWGYLFTAVLLFVLAGIGGFLAYRFFKKGSPPVPTMAIEEAKLVRETVTGGGSAPTLGAPAAPSKLPPSEKPTLPRDPS